jgi:hypothetical protein
LLLLIKSTSNTAKLYSKLLIIGFVLFLLPSVISICVISPVVAQTPETSSTTAPGLPTIQITTPQDGQQVPPGELSIQGISSDDEETECQVYADVNDITPMRNVTAAGDSEEDNDFSRWTFAYKQDYQLIKQGENELTAKITCSDDGEFDLNPFPAGAQTTSSSSSPLSEWHTVNVTAVQGAAVPSPSPSPSSTEEASDDDEESEEESSGDTGVDVNDDDGSNDDGTGGAGGNSNNGLFGGDSFFD